MRHEVRMPRLGETVDVVVALEWQVAVGDTVSADDPVLLVETDKTESEVPATVSGVVVSLDVDEGADVSTGDLVCIIESPDS